LQPQQGILTTPNKHGLIQVYDFEDLPLIVMNVVRIGAQIPGMACELESGDIKIGSKNKNKRNNVIAVVGFGPLVWTLITPDAPVRGGFRSLDEIEIEDVEVPRTEGDIFLYFTSDKADFNRILADKVKDQFGSSGNLIEELVLNDGVHSNIESEKEKVLIDKSQNLDTMESSFVVTQKFKMDNDFFCDLPKHSFPCQVDSNPGRYIITFSNDPQKLEDHAESVSYPAVSRGIFFVPSLDLLTSLRMGGIRMGSLAINAKWKE
jgi:porphyrinogen peroxidase